MIHPLAVSWRRRLSHAWREHVWPPHRAAADRLALTRRPYRPLVNGRLVTVEVIRVNRQRTPGRSLERAVATLARYVSGDVRLVWGESVSLATDGDGSIHRSQLEPVLDRRGHTAPCDIAIVLVPCISDMPHRGECRQLAGGGHAVVINARNMRAGIRAIIPVTSWWQLVLFHELAHALAVPDRAERLWRLSHCTHPGCVLYPTVDVRSLLAAAVRWRLPLDLCPACQSEVRSAQRMGRPFAPTDAFDLQQWRAAVVELNPDSYFAWTERAAAHYERGDYALALADFSKGLDLNPQDALAWNNRGMTHHRLGQFDQAVADLSQAISLAPKPFRYRIRALVFAQSGQYAAAIADYEQCLALSPDDAKAMGGLAWLLSTRADMSLRDPARAADLARRACELTHWRDPEPVSSLAAACAAQGDWDQAITHQSRAFDLSKPTDKDGRRRALESYRRHELHDARGAGVTNEPG